VKLTIPTQSNRDDLDHLTIHRGSVVEPRHLSLVVSNTWPDENDEDRHYEVDGNPLAAVFWYFTLIGFLGFLIWAAMR
jgi:hypothetical protein